MIIKGSGVRMIFLQTTVVSCWSLQFRPLHLTIPSILRFISDHQQHKSYYKTIFLTEWAVLK